MKKISRRSFMAAAAVSVAALAMTACGGSASSAASSVASSAASSEAASSAAAAELTTVEAGKLTMATNAAFPPYEMTTDAGEFEGIDVDTAKAIAEKLGLELQIDDMDFDAALLSVQQGKADIVMAGVTVTDERKAVMDFSDSYATGIQSIIVPNDSDIASPDDLSGKKIGTQRGTTGYIYCSDDFGDDAVVAYDSGLTAVQALNNGQVDAEMCIRDRTFRGFSSMSFLVAVRPASAFSLKKPFFSSRVRARASLVVSLGTATFTLSSFAAVEAAAEEAVPEAAEDAVEEEPPHAVRAAAAAATPETFRKSRRVIIVLFPLYYLIKCTAARTAQFRTRPVNASMKKAPVLDFAP